MVTQYYPPLSSEIRGHLETVRLHLIEDEGYLDNPLCPYPLELRNFLKGILIRGSARTSSGEILASEELDLEAETTSLLRELREFGETMKDTADATEKAAYFRVATSLLEKLMSLKERASDVKQFSRLIQFMLRFAEDHLEPDVRTRLMDNLKSFSEK